MLNTIKSMTFIFAMPILLTYCFSMDVVKSSTYSGNRQPAIEKAVKSPTLKQNVYKFLVSSR